MKPLVLRDDVGSPVLLPAILGLIRADGPVLAVADDGQLSRRNSHGLEKLRHRAGALVAQRHVIFVRAALVAMAFNTQLLSGVIRQDGAITPTSSCKALAASVRIELLS